MEEKVRTLEEASRASLLYRTMNLGPYCKETRWRGSAYSWVVIERIDLDTFIIREHSRMYSLRNNIKYVTD